MQLFPAVLIGGPPNSGKSVLTYNLSQALRQRGVQHYALRAAPDGEGDWASEADQALVRTILVPRAWTPGFVDHICQSLAHRHLPLIVDVGGRPAEWQEAIFDHCTHAILLTPDESSHATWLDLISRHTLILIADLRSELEGTDTITAEQPILQGTIAGLERGHQIGGPTFAALTERLARLFAYDAAELRRAHIASAPVETAIDLDRLARSLGVTFVGEKALWEPQHLPAVLNYLPGATPLAIYGRGPNWLYAALACLASPAPLYQFDVRLGWITPPKVSLGLPPAASPLQAHPQPQTDHILLVLTVPTAYLDYSIAQEWIVPPIPPEQGLVLSGKLPLWLWTALAAAYKETLWLAIYQPQLGDKAIVVSSRTPDVLPGCAIVTSVNVMGDHTEV